LLPYVECDPKGVAADPERCAQVGVRKYPTWFIRGTRYEGVLSLDELAQYSGFTSTESSSGSTKSSPGSR
jgi:hypothetical protein